MSTEEPSDADPGERANAVQPNRIGRLGDETLRLHSGPTQGSGEDGDASTTGSTWWSRYRAQLVPTLTQTALQVVESDCDYILERGVLGAGEAGGAAWPSTRVRRGLVMGAVQSGKTASMIGVAAKSLDSGVDAVVVLAGTRVALWRQTLDRLIAQLDQPGPEDVQQASRRVLLPSLTAMTSSEEAPALAHLYNVPGQQARRMVRKHRPLLCVAMKNVHHIRALADTLRHQVWPAATEADRPFHLLVLDDEADDGSILDARVEQSVDPVLGDLKQIPRAIVDLWETRPHTGESASPALYVTYIGYTATPQANFLQSDHNPLAPRDFVTALRTPYDHGTNFPRQTTYSEPQGLGSYYTGGETYYRRLAPDALVRAPSSRELEATRAALVDFLVAGAIRMWREPDRLGPQAAKDNVYSSARQARDAVIRPHTMLVHPSAGIADQFAAARLVLRAAGLSDDTTAAARLDTGERTLSTETLLESLTKQPEPWLNALEDYRNSASKVATAFGLPTTPRIPAADAWGEIEQILRDEIIPGTHLSVVNSDPAADDRPSFDPIPAPQGGWRAPRDLSTIFVSGNVMSRGLTLEGLATTLFLRSSNEPMADTQMQMQRWFGYRGRDIELCRVYIPTAQQDLFRAYHEADEALRRDVLHLMDREPNQAPTPQVLQGRDFIATGKLANVRNVPLCPGAFPFITLMNPATHPDPNLNLVRDTFHDRSSDDLSVAGRVRGRLLEDTLSLAEAADLLDDLSYDRYKPGGDAWETNRWRGVATNAGITPENDADQVLPLYRAPTFGSQQPSTPRRDCPYAIAAYLRLWRACLTRHARGLFPTDNARTPWSMLDLHQRQLTQPRFHVGIRFGSAAPAAGEPLSELDFPIPMMKRDVKAGGALAGTWGTRNPTNQPGAYLGDGYFDYHAQTTSHAPVGLLGATWRPVGAPGLILFHVIDRSPEPNPTLAVGVAIPLGGPDQFAARSAD